MEIIRHNFSDFNIIDKNYRITLNTISYEPPRFPWAIDMHVHNNFEIHFIPEGTGTIHLAKDVISVSKGMFCITGPGIMHAQTSGLDNPMQEYGLNLSITQITPPTSSFERLLDSIIHNPQFVGQDQFDGSRKCQEIINEHSAHKAGYRQKIISLVIDLLVSMGRVIQEETNTENFEQKNESINRPYALDNLLRGFREVDITPQYLADKLFISTRQLSRIMKEQYNMTLTEKLHSLRIEYAKNLLRSSTLSISEISELSGYATQQHFCRMFKKITNTTPAAFRKMT